MEGKEKRVEEKEVEKREKEKVVLGKVLFVFCLTVSLPLPFFPQHPPRHHTLTHHTIQHDALVHTITCKQVRVLCCLFLGVDSETHTASSTPHTPSLDITQHTHQPNTDTAHGANSNEMTTTNEKEIGQRGKSGTTQQHQHTD